MTDIAEQDSLERLIANYRSAKANGDPAKYVHVISVKQAHQTADTLSQMRAALTEIAETGKGRKLNWGDAQDSVDIAREVLAATTKIEKE